MAVIANTSAMPIVLLAYADRDGNKVAWNQIPVIAWKNTIDEDADYDEQTREWIRDTTDGAPFIAMDNYRVHYQDQVIAYVMPDCGIPGVKRIYLHAQNRAGGGYYERLDDIPQGSLLEYLREIH